MSAFQFTRPGRRMFSDNWIRSIMFLHFDLNLNVRNISRTEGCMERSFFENNTNHSIEKEHSISIQV